MCFLVWCSGEADGHLNVGELSVADIVLQCQTDLRSSASLDFQEDDLDQ
jgi:hypothetical protein